MSTYTYNRPKRRSDRGMIFFVVLMIAIIAVCAWIGLTSIVMKGPTRKAPTHDSLAPTYTYNGEIIRWYVLVDPDTSVQYLVNDRGGCTPRLDERGNVVGVQTYT